MRGPTGPVKRAGPRVPGERSETPGPSSFMEEAGSRISGAPFALLTLHRVRDTCGNVVLPFYSTSNTSIRTAPFMRAPLPIARMRLSQALAGSAVSNRIKVRK
jgi:hypothetical protein